jgi:GrpB-like predicted nucleotidyltransferase (UPF0157 family)
MVKIIIEPYNPSWAAEFQKTKATLETILQGISYISIEHVGSTSIPDLAAKPVIDIDIIIPPSSLAATRTALAGAGYTDMGECGVPGRFQFRQPGFGAHQGTFGERTPDGALRQNTYAMIEGCPAIRNHLDIKRVLLEDEGLREDYGALKWELAEREFEGIAAYGGAKLAVLRKILRKAGWTDEDFADLKKPLGFPSQ